MAAADGAQGDLARSSSRADMTDRRTTKSAARVQRNFEGKVRANTDARRGLRVRRLPSQSEVFRELLRDAQYERGQVRLNPG